MIDLNRVSGRSDDIINEIANQFTYHPWDQEQIGRGSAVRLALETATQVIVANVPACPDRTVALRKLREARMDCNSAITHDGKY